MLPIRTILHPTDFSDRSRDALALAAGLARDYSARLVILHVRPRSVMAFGQAVVPPESADLRAEAREDLDQLPVAGCPGPVERRLAEGEPAEAITHVARNLPADLIVMASHGRTGVGRLVMGSVAERVLRTAPCPVLAVTAPFPAHPAAAAGEALGAAGPM